MDGWRQKTEKARRSLVGLVIAAFALAWPQCTREPDPAGKRAPAAPQAVAAPQPDPAANKLALLVGISDYPDGGPTDLAGPENDVALVAKLLRERFGFPEQNVRTLLNAEATHSGILSAFREHLIANAREGAEVVFWYAGHGSRVGDATGRESGGLDNTLVSFDARTVAPDGGFDVSDDELFTLLRELSGVTDRILVVTDSCYSEGAARGNADERDQITVSRFTPGNREVPDRSLVEKLWGGEAILDDDAAARNGAVQHGLHIGACTKWQLAAEMRPDSSDETYGVLTWNLVRVLERARSAATWREVIETVQLEIEAQGHAQSPQFDGDADRKVFGGGFVDPPMGYPAHVHATEGGGRRLVVAAGALAGLAVGSKLAVFRPYGEEALGHAVVVGLGDRGFEATAVWSGEGDPEVGVGESLRVLERSRPATAPRLRVYCGDPWIVERLGLEEWVTWVEVPQAEYLLADSDGPLGFSLKTAEGVLVWPATRGAIPKAPTPLDVVRNAVLYRALARVPVEGGEFKLRARLVAPAAEGDPSEPAALRALRGRPARVQPVGGGSGTQWSAVVEHADGELAELEVLNESDRSLYVAVVSLEEVGHVRTAIWGAQEDGDDHLLRPGEARTVFVSVQAPSAWRLERPMRDRYVILATEERISVEQLTSWRPGTHRSSASPVPWVLAGAVHGKGTRSDEIAGPRSWGVTWLDLFIR